MDAGAGGYVYALSVSSIGTDESSKVEAANVFLLLNVSEEEGLVGNGDDDGGMDVRLQVGHDPEDKWISRRKWVSPRRMVFYFI